MQRKAFARAIVHGLIDRGIKLLALDFDLTILDVHTGGAWIGPIHHLAQHVRPSFRALMEAALETDLLHMCIVTYSLQQDVIQDLLRAIWPYCDTSRILVRTSFVEWQQKNQLSKQSLGKQQHIGQVVSDLYHFHRVVIHPHEVLLMDDDKENIDVARRFGHAAFLVKETVTLEDIYAFVEKVKGCEVIESNSSYSHLPESFVSMTNNPRYNPNEFKSVSLPRPGHSASVYLTSPNAEGPNLRQERGMPPTKVLDFAIPRPTVVNESIRHTPQVDMKIGRPGYDTSQPHSTTYMVMTSGR